MVQHNKSPEIRLRPGRPSAPHFQLCDFIRAKLIDKSEKETDGKNLRAKLTKGELLAGNMPLENK